jgi:SOS regulatory protein LexA
MNASSVTKKQKKVLDFINNYITENGISPTIEEIRKNLKLKAVSTIHEHIKSLKDKGYISKENNSQRSIELTKSIKSVISIPILGLIAAGRPIEAIENLQETISVINSTIKSNNDHYALKVTGDSMIDEGIFDGDIVIIKKQSVAENRQTVVAIIDDNQATLKKIYREKSRFRLEPRNQNLLPFFRKEVEIRGVVVQVIRNINNKEIIPVVKKSDHGFKTIDLFAGVGGIRLGFEKAGFETVFANDFEPRYKETLVSLDETQHAEVEKFLEIIEDMDDVQNVFVNI